MKQIKDILKRIAPSLFAVQVLPVKETFHCPHCQKETLVNTKEGKLRCLSCTSLYSIEEIDHLELTPEEKALALFYAAMDLLALNKEEKSQNKDKNRNFSDLDQIESLLLKAEKICKAGQKEIGLEECCYLSGWIYQLQAEISQRKGDLEQALVFWRKAISQREQIQSLHINMDTEIDGLEIELESGCSQQKARESNLYLLVQSYKQAAWLAARLQKKGEKAWIDKGLQILHQLERDNPDLLEFILSQTADFYEMKLAYFAQKGDEKGREKVFKDYLGWMRRLEKEYTQNVSLFTLRFIGPILKEAKRLQEKGTLNGSLYFYFKALDYQFNLFMQRPGYASLKPLLETYQALARLLIVLNEKALAARLLTTLTACFEDEFRLLLARARPKAKVLALIEETKQAWNSLLALSEEEIISEISQAELSIKAQKKRGELLHLYNIAHLHLHLSFLETCRGDRRQRELLLYAARETLISLQVAEFYSLFNVHVLELRARVEAELARAFSLSDEYEEAARLYEQAAGSYRQLFELEPCWAHSRSRMQMHFYLADISQRSGNEEKYRSNSQQALDLYEQYEQWLKQ